MWSLNIQRTIPCRWKIQLEHEGSINLPLLMYVAVCHILCCFYTVELIKIKLALEQSSLGFDR